MSDERSMGMNGENFTLSYEGGIFLWGGVPGGWIGGLRVLGNYRLEPTCLYL